MYYYGNDRLGTPQILTDSTNTVVWEAVYDPFGQADINSNSTVVSNFRFPGQYYDQETGLHYNYHRYYDPRTGRYLRPDPIGLEDNILLKIYTLMNCKYLPGGDINSYGYVLNNSINYTDPFGLFTLCSLKCGFLKFAGLYNCNLSWSLDYQQCFDNVIVTKDCIEKAKKENKQCKKHVEKNYEICLDDCECE